MLSIKKAFQPVLALIGDGLYRARRAQQLAQAIRSGLLAMGEYSYGYPEILDSGGNMGYNKGKVVIGRYCSIAMGVKILVGGNHHPDWVSMYPVRIAFDLPDKYADGQPWTKGDVVIGSDVWIGQDAMILSGVRIGHGAVVAAQSVCTKDVPDFGIVGGNPARLIRMRFSDSQIQALLRIAWWNWGRDEVIANVGMLCSPDIDGFIRAFDSLSGVNFRPPSP